MVVREVSTENPSEVPGRGGVLVRTNVSERLTTDLSGGSDGLGSSILKKCSNVATCLCRLTVSSVCYQVLCVSEVRDVVRELSDENVEYLDYFRFSNGQERGDVDDWDVDLYM